MYFNVLYLTEENNGPRIESLSYCLIYWRAIADRLFIVYLHARIEVACGGLAGSLSVVQCVTLCHTVAACWQLQVQFLAIIRYR
jgi:hypothetical protein